MARRIAGPDELDKDVLRRIASIKRGGLVEARWYKDGEPRLYYLEPATAKRPKAPPATPHRRRLRQFPAGDAIDEASARHVSELAADAPCQFSWLNNRVEDIRKSVTCPLI
jgi:hypothetical protein